MVLDRDHAATSPSHIVFPAIWFFIAADCTTFALFFGGFMAERVAQLALFDASAATLDVRLGLINTLILISSSWLVALAAAAARQGEIIEMRRRLAAGLIVGLGFFVIKCIEYGAKISQGITPLTNEFYTWYFGLTGLHFAHYIVGMAVLSIVLFLSTRRTRVDGQLSSLILSGGIYWHMVDLLWVFIFPMFYLLGI